MQTSSLLAILAAMASNAFAQLHMVRVCVDTNQAPPCFDVDQPDVGICKDLTALGINDAISSLTVFLGFKCTLFADSNCSGATELFKANPDKTVEFNSVSAAMNDKASSISCARL